MDFRNIISAPFSERDYIFGNNNKTHIFRIGGPDGLILPLQPLVSIRIGRNWVLTEVSGSATNETLSGTQVKENMGRSDAIITFRGVFMSTAPTLMQGLNLQGGNEEDHKHWAEKLRELENYFNEETALQIDDWAPAEDTVRIPIVESLPNDQDLFERKDLGVSMFGELDIKYAVLLSLNIDEISGAERKGYTLRLQQTQPIELEDITPCEEGQE